LKSLESLAVAGERVTDSGLTALGKARTLRDLTIGTAVHNVEAWNPGDPQITNEGLRSVGRLTELESLRVYSWRITGHGMAHLDGLKHLKLLYLTGCRVGDDGMRSIGGHMALRELRLDRWVTRQGLAELARLTSLEKLTVNLYIQDDDLIPIGRITSLGSLRCGWRDVTDEGLRNMKNMARLQSLDLSGSPKVTDAGMAYVGQLKGLETLRLNAGIGDAGVAHLSEVTSLNDLYLGGTKVTDSGLAKLTSLCQLRRLFLGDTHVTAAGVALFRGMKNLKEIDINYTQISDDDTIKLQELGIPAFKNAGTFPAWMKR